MEGLFVDYLVERLVSLGDLGFGGRGGWTIVELDVGGHVWRFWWVRVEGLGRVV